MSLKVSELSKSFNGKIAVDHVSFDMNEPGVFGLIGTNGAGKTTTIRMILGIMISALMYSVMECHLLRGN